MKRMIATIVKSLILTVAIGCGYLWLGVHPTFAAAPPSFWAINKNWNYTYSSGSEEDKCIKRKCSKQLQAEKKRIGEAIDNLIKDHHLTRDGFIDNAQNILLEKWKVTEESDIYKKFSSEWIGRVIRGELRNIVVQDFELIAEAAGCTAQERFEFFTKVGINPITKSFLPKSNERFPEVVGKISSELGQICLDCFTAYDAGEREDLLKVTRLARELLNLSLRNRHMLPEISKLVRALGEGARSTTDTAETDGAPSDPLTAADLPTADGAPSDLLASIVQPTLPESSVDQSRLEETSCNLVNIDDLRSAIPNDLYKTGIPQQVQLNQPGSLYLPGELYSPTRLYPMFGRGIGGTFPLFYPPPL